MMETLNFKTQICTTIEQSKRLLELGLKKETADCYYSYEVEEHGENRFWEIIVSDWEPYWEITNNTIPAWSLHRLIELYKDVEDTSMWSLENVNYNRLIQCIGLAIKHDAFNKDYLK